MTHDHEKFLRELRLFLEEICCNLCLFLHAGERGGSHENIRITPDGYLGINGVFADIRVEVDNNPPYFIEVKHGYSRSRVVQSLVRKFAPGTSLGGATRIKVVLHQEVAEMWPEIVAEVQPQLQPGLELELWDEKRVFSMLRDLFGVEVDSFSEQHVLELRLAIDQAQGKHAFGDAWKLGDQVQQALMWHYGFWRLRELREHKGLTARTILPPGLYSDVVVVMADLCGFSSYVRDTRENDVIRYCLSTFYSKARYEILSTGGMMYQFVGDEVIGLFGLPDRREGYLDSALECSRALLHIGNAVSHEWQRHIDRIQSSRGVHVGIALGDMQVLSLRPFSRAHLGGLGEVINLSSRLLAHAGPGEIVASNTFYQSLGPAYQNRFTECEPVEAKNMGTFQAWKHVK